jgi:hypothetical protein
MYGDISMIKTYYTFLFVLAIILCWGCSKVEPMDEQGDQNQEDPDAGADADTDVDADTDTDADTDMDTDSDSDSDSDSDTDVDGDTDADSDSDLDVELELTWLKRAGGQHSEVADAIHMLEDGSAWITGVFDNRTTIGPGEPNETHLSSVGGYDVFYAKYEPDGTLAWANSAGGSGTDRGSAITGLPDGSVFISGRFSSVATFGKGEPNQTELTASGHENIFVAKFKADGLLEWASAIGGPSWDRVRGIFAGTDGSVWVSGSLGNVNDDGAGDLFVAKLDPQGNTEWLVSAEGETNSSGDYVSVAEDGSILLVGLFSNSVTLGPGEENEMVLESAGATDILLAELTEDGELVWAKGIGGEGGDGAWTALAHGDNALFLVGQYSEQVVFGEGEENETVLSAVGSTDILVAKYRRDG